VPFPRPNAPIVAGCAIRAHCASSRRIDVWYMLILDVIGYVPRKLERPISGAIIFARPILTPWRRRLRGMSMPTASPRET